MCTCIDYKTKDHYFGRTLDLEYRFNEEVTITPRNYEFNFKNEGTKKTKYAIIGMATIEDGYPLYAEATNEVGLSLAGLYFPNNSKLFDVKEGKLNLAAYELVPYLLGNYSTVKEIKEFINNLNITNQVFKEGLPPADMHYMIADAEEAIIIEQMQDGLHIYDNKIHVLTNNPPFYYHLENINNYLNLTSEYKENTFSNSLNLNATGVGFGSIGLPGDTSPTGRFIRAAFNLQNSVCTEDPIDGVTQFFHILDSVAMVKGSTKTKAGLQDITAYTSCINTTKGIYYYKTYDNNQITAIKLTEENKNSDSLTRYKLRETQNIYYEN